MDPLTHTATGLFLSRAGLNRLTPMAAPIVMLAANSPDIDIVTLAGGPLTYLHYHRHLTHALAAMPVMALLPVVLVWAGGAGGASDPSMTSNNYKVNESEVGGNGCNFNVANQCGVSANYSLNPATDNGGTSLGETAVGTSKSTNYSSGAGFDTTAEPGPPSAGKIREHLHGNILALRPLGD